MITFKITNVKEASQYKGAYKRIFSILGKDLIFSEVYETDDSVGLVGSDYFLEVSMYPDADQFEKILKIKNVTIHSERPSDFKHPD